MWLSGLHIPESYLTALVQATCRRNGWPLDRSTLFTQVTRFQDADEVNERAGQGTVNVTCLTLHLELPSQNHAHIKVPCGLGLAQAGLLPTVLSVASQESSFLLETSSHGVGGWQRGLT